MPPGRVADFADLKSMWTIGNPRVASGGNPPSPPTGCMQRTWELRRAALCTTSARVSVPFSVCATPGPLSRGEREQCGCTPTTVSGAGRCRGAKARPVSRGAWRDCDGSGYHRGSGTVDLPLTPGCWRRRLLPGDAGAACQHAQSSQRRPRRELAGKEQQGQLLQEAVHRRGKRTGSRAPQRRQRGCLNADARCAAAGRGSGTPAGSPPARDLRQDMR